MSYVVLEWGCYCDTLRMYQLFHILVENNKKTLNVIELEFYQDFIRAFI